MKTPQPAKAIGRKSQVVWYLANANGMVSIENALLKLYVVHGAGSTHIALL
jgi:hypothetical protein